MPYSQAELRVCLSVAEPEQLIESTLYKCGKLVIIHSFLFGLPMPRESETIKKKSE